MKQQFSLSLIRTHTETQKTQISVGYRLGADNLESACVAGEIFMQGMAFQDTDHVYTVFGVSLANYPQDSEFCKEGSWDPLPPPPKTNGGKKKGGNKKR